MKISQFLLLSLALNNSALFSAEKVAVEATKFALKPALTSLSKGLYQNSKLTFDITYKNFFIHEFSHLSVAAAFGRNANGFFVGPDGGIVMGIENADLKDSIIGAAGPLGGLAYMTRYIYKNHALKQKLPFAILSLYAWTHVFNLLPTFPGCDGYQILSNLKGISLDKKRDNIQKQIVLDKDLSLKSAGFCLAGYASTNIIGKKYGYTLLGKPALKLLPILTTVALLGPILGVQKNDKESWEFKMHPSVTYQLLHALSQNKSPEKLLTNSESKQEIQ